MAGLNIILSDSMRKFVDEQVKLKGYGNPSEYIRHLIQLEQERVTQQQLVMLLLAGLESNDFVEVNQDWWELQRTQLNNGSP
jgi:antitoxin ParD1/3/4